MTERMTAAEFSRTRGAIPQARNKFGAQRTKVDGQTFHSKKEATRYCDLRNLQRGGEITRLQCQAPFHLVGANGPLLNESGKQITYIADFVYLDVRSGARIIEDTKGFKTPEYLLKKAIMRSMGHEILET